MQAIDAFAAVKRGKAVAFLGAGFPLGALNADGTVLPKGNELATRLMDAAGVNEEADYGLAADLYQKKHSGNPTALASFLEKQFLVKTITNPQARFAFFPWRRIYTTNYDNVVELGSEKAGITRLPVTTQAPPEQHNRNFCWIVHLHGYVGLLKSGFYIPPFVLSRTSYLDMELPKTRWPTQLQSDAAAADAVFIIGYSLADLHIAKLLRKIPANRPKTFIVTQPNPPEALASYAKEFGTLLPIGLDGLVKAVEAVDVSGLTTSEARELLSFQEIPLPDSPEAPNPDDVYKLLISGTFNPKIYLNCLLDPSRPYSFSRNYALGEIAKWNGKPRKFIVSSRIGNGKTIFLRQAEIFLAKNNYRVFRGLHPVEGFHEEIDLIRHGDGPFAFFYEGLREFEPSIKAIADMLAVRDVLIVATRPTAFATDFENLRNVVGEGFTRLDLDTLNSSDISDLDRVLQFYGLWGNTAGNTQLARFKFVQEDCGSEVRSVVLHTFQTSSISDRIKEPVTRLLQRSSELGEVLATLLAVRLADCPLDFSDVCELVSADSADVRAGFFAAGVNDFFPDEDLKARSAILAEHVLSTLIPAAVCLNALTKLVFRLVDYRDADWRYEDSTPRLLRFAVVTRIFPGSERRAFIIRLYEAILEIAFLREDPQFWLQLAMARMEGEDWVPAEKSLETSYQKARSRPGYRTYMLDNQMIRFLLISAIGRHSIDFDAAALRACELMNVRFAQMRGGIDVYVYRNTGPLLQFQANFRSKLSVGAASAVSAMIEKLRDRLVEIRRTRRLDDEEERFWNLLKR